MTPIDFNTCTALDVIQRSITCHPTVFTDTLSRNAATHEQAAIIMHDMQAREAAYKMAQNCRSVRSMIEVLGRLADDLTFDERMQAFSAAARLQLIPFNAAQQIIAR